MTQQLPMPATQLQDSKKLSNPGTTFARAWELLFSHDQPSTISSLRSGVISSSRKVESEGTSRRTNQQHGELLKASRGGKHPKAVLHPEGSKKKKKKRPIV